MPLMVMAPSKGFRTYSTVILSLLAGFTLGMYGIYKGITDFMGLGSMIAMIVIPVVGAQAYKSVGSIKAGNDQLPGGHNG